MKTQIALALLLFAGLMIISAGCDEGIDDWNSSAKISGEVYTDASHTQGVPGVQVILESDASASDPYTGPDRWTVTGNDGHFEKSVFLGNNGSNSDGTTNYNWTGDLSVKYFWHDKSFDWTGGISVSPGSHFTLPAVDTTMFSVIGGGQ